MATGRTAQLPTQLCRFEDGRIHSGFVIWQHAYAEHGIPTFPVTIGDNKKIPMVRGWTKVWPDLSAKWGQQFPLAPAFGLNLGPKKWHTDRKGKRLPPASGIAELDIDSRDERILSDAITRHGNTPIVIRAASRKFKLWYQHNGECRRIRPWSGLPIDVLGGGYTVAPPSYSPHLDYQQYEFIQGGLDDLDRLPVMVNLDPGLYVAQRGKAIKDKASPMRGMRDGDGRNKALFRAIGPIARGVYADGQGMDVLLSAALSHNGDCAHPLDIEEVRKITNSVWKMTLEHRNWIGNRQTDVVSFCSNVDAFFLLEFLRVIQGASDGFMVANGLSEDFGWTRKRLASAREALIELGYIARIKPAWSGSPATYVWP
jgi:Bifunctional DNA primase/polymerase, N-terminal